MWLAPPTVHAPRSHAKKSCEMHGCIYISMARWWRPLFVLQLQHVTGSPPSPASSFFSLFLSLLSLFLTAPLHQSPPLPVPFLFPLFLPSYLLLSLSFLIISSYIFPSIFLHFSSVTLHSSHLLLSPFLSPLPCFFLFMSLCLTGQEISLISALISSDQTCRSQSAPSD